MSFIDDKSRIQQFAAELVLRNYIFNHKSIHKCRALQATNTKHSYSSISCTNSKYFDYSLRFRIDSI